MWPNTRILDLLGIEHPIIQAPMAGSVGSDLVIAVAESGGLGSLPCAMLNADQMRTEIGIIRQRTNRPINLNFFCHETPDADDARMARWRTSLDTYFRELDIDPDAPLPNATRSPFNDAACEVVEEFNPEVVSFHFGLPEHRLLERVRATGAKIISSATTVNEARWLEDHGCDAIIAQGAEAGGHRGIFLGQDTSTQPGTFALVPQVVDAVKVPVIAAGGVSDARGIVAAFALGASAVQIGTAYLFCPEAKVGPLHRERLLRAKDDETVLTNVFTGRPARGLVNRLVSEVGPISDAAPAFPLAAAAVTPMRLAAEARGSSDFTSLWAGQAAALGREVPAGELTVTLARDALHALGRAAAEKPMNGDAFSVERTAPVFRIFDEAKAKEFYLDFLGFKLDWEHRFDAGLPLYAQVSRGGITLHLSEHHGDATPGATLFLTISGIDALHAELVGKGYKNLRPSIEHQPWGRVMTLTDPFGNRIKLRERHEP